MEKSPLRGNNSKGIPLNQIVSGANKRNTAGDSSSASVTYQSVNKKVKLPCKTRDKTEFNEMQQQNKHKINGIKKMDMDTHTHTHTTYTRMQN